MTRFLRELLAYTSQRPLHEVWALDRAELAAAALDALRARPFLVVLDGFERLLSAYHRFDPSKLRDDEVEASQRSLIEPQADEVVRALTGAGPSKLLISTRLLPDALQTRAGRLAEGVAYLGEVRLLRLKLARDAGDVVTEADVEAVEAGLELWANRVRYARFRRELLTGENELERALDAALAVERLERVAGIEVLPAARAALLARLGRSDEALVAVQDALARLERVHPANRPHAHLADALAALGRPDEAAVHALQAYRQAWADGPPYAFHWDLRDARERLARLGVAIPEPPTVDPDSVRIPLENEIEAYIATLEASGGDEKRGS